MSCAYKGHADSGLRFGEDAIDARWFDISWKRGKGGRGSLELVHGDIRLAASLVRADEGGSGGGGGGGGGENYRIENCDGIAFDHAAIIARALDAES